MNDSECPHETIVRQAIEADGWTESLRQHVSQCASCREVVRVARFMKGVARAMERQAVPDAYAMWSRIHLAERQRLAERAQRPVRFAWMFAKCWLVGGAGLIFYREWHLIGNLFLTMPNYVYIAIAAGAAIFAMGRRALKG